MISEHEEELVLKDEYLRDGFITDDFIKGDYIHDDFLKDDYVIQTLNTAAPPSTLHVDEHLKNFDYRYSDSCGWHKFYPKQLQRLNNPKWFLFFLIVFSLAQAMIINGFTNVGLSTLEKQFKLTSKQSAMIVAAKEISSLTLIAVLSFYGSFGDKPKYLGVGAITTAVGSLLYVLPHAMVGNYIPDNAGRLMLGEEVCQHRSLNETISEARCSILGSSEWYYLFVFIIAKLLIGAGTAPLFTLGAAYIDENVKPKVSPGYLGVWYVSTSFGPGIGFVAGGSLLNVYVDLIQPPGVDMSPEDPRWIGAWWLGHCFGGLLILLSSCALMAYPRSMPGAKEMRLQAMREGTVQREDKRLQGKLADIVPATWTLLKNPTFIFNTLALTSGTIISTGLGPFVVTYLKAQFGVSTMKAGIASGITLIPGTAGGIFIGSWLMKRLKGRETCQHAAKYCFTFQLLALFTVGSFLIPGCRSPVMAGVHKPYYNGSIAKKNVTSWCNKDCSCSGVQYEPLCGVDNITYFSPCHLGCNVRVSKYGYGDCSCMDPKYLRNNHHYNYNNINSNINSDINPYSTDKPPVAGPVTWSSGSKWEYTDVNRWENVAGGIPIAGVIGPCDRDCKHFYPFLGGIVCLLLLNFINAVPNKMVVMRCVPDNERAYALGIQWIVLTLLGAIPGPILFGLFIDKSCGLWEATCHGPGNCLVYDNEQLSYSLAYVIFVFQVVAAVFYFISWKTYKIPPQSVATTPTPNECNVTDKNTDAVQKKHDHTVNHSNTFPSSRRVDSGNISPILEDTCGTPLTSFPAAMAASRTSDATSVATERTTILSSCVSIETASNITSCDGDVSNRSSRFGGTL